MTLTRDDNKDITSISYNHLNLPTEVAINSEDISYIYDATGVKLKKEVSTGTITEYAGNYIYENGTLQFFSTPEGYVTPDGQGGYDYVYQYKDHLGNIRLSYVDDGNDGLEIVEENNYYPFGLKHKGYNDSGISSLGNDVAQKWKFGGKEYDDTFDINTYDFGARNYDPALGRWMNIDPLAEQMRRHSPYNYAFDNPVYFQDYDGMMPTGPNPIKRLIRQYMRKTLKSQRGTLVKSRNSFRSLIKEHKQKLDDFKMDPIGNSSPEALAKMKADNPTDEVLLERAKGRIPALEKQIKKQEGELAKVESKISKIDKAISDLGDDAAKTTTVAATGTIDPGNKDEESAEKSTKEKVESAAVSITGFGSKISDFVENFGTKTFGDNDFGKIIDEFNPLNLGLSDILKFGHEATEEHTKKKTN